jgi:hypothetical protein
MITKQTRNEAELQLILMEEIRRHPECSHITVSPLRARQIAIGARRGFAAAPDRLLLSPMKLQGD